LLPRLDGILFHDEEHCREVLADDASDLVPVAFRQGFKTGKLESPRSVVMVVVRRLSIKARPRVRSVFPAVGGDEVLLVAVKDLGHLPFRLAMPWPFGVLRLMRLLGTAAAH
jgi:hypothetical protein